MEYSVKEKGSGIYHITIRDTNEVDRSLFSLPLKEMEPQVYQHYSEAISRHLGLGYYIAEKIDDRDFPYQLIARLIKNK